MTTQQLISALSAQGKADLAAAAQWLNPLPDDVKALMEKLTMSLQIVKYSQNRQGAQVQNSTANEHLAALVRLKAEIDSLLSSGLIA